jgi:hypothetical protein
MTPAERLAEAVARRNEGEDTPPIKGASNAPTEGKGFVQGARNFAGDLLQGLLPGGPTAADMRRFEENPEQAPGFLGRTGQGVKKGFSWGGLGTMGAVAEEIGAQVRGTGGDKTIMQRRDELNGLIDDNSNVGGEIVGALGSSVLGPARAAVGGAIKGGQAVAPALAKFLSTRGLAPAAGRGVAASGASGAGGFMYSMLEDGDPDKALDDALMASAFGGLGQLGADTIGNIFKRAGVSLDPKRDAAELIIRKLAATDNGAGNLINDAGENILDAGKIKLGMAAGEGDTLLAQFPDELLRTFKKTVDDPNADVQVALRPFRRYLTNTAAAQEPAFQQTLDEVLGAPNVRDANQFAMDSQETRKALIPMYDAALANENLAEGMIKANGNVSRVPGKRIQQMVDTAFKGLRKANPEAIRLHSYLNDLVAGKSFTPREMLQLRHVLDQVTYTGKLAGPVGTPDITAVDTEVVTQALLPLRNVFNKVMHEIAPDLKDLDAAHGSIYSQGAGYEAGSKLFTGKNARASSVQIFRNVEGRAMDDNAAFIEGAKNGLLTLIEGKSPKYVNALFSERSGPMGALRELVGEEGLAKMQQAAQTRAVSSGLKKALDKGVPAEGDPAGVLRRLMDAAIVAGSPTGLTGTSIAAGTLRNNAGNMEQSVSSLGPLRASAMADMASQPADQGAQMVNDALIAGRPGLWKSIMGMTAPMNSEE